MKTETQRKLERVEELLDQMEDMFRDTRAQIQEIIDSITEEEWDFEDEDDEEEIDAELVIHMEEIFGVDE